MLNGKTILLCVTGGIACYKAAALASALVKQGACVQVLMTKNATEFVGPHTFESLTGNRVSVDTFDRNYPFQVEHISLADQADLVLVAPATANVLAKLAHGLADDMLTTTVLACDCPKIASPAMNTRMYENPVTQDNLAALRRYGWEIVEPEDLRETVLHAISHERDMDGLRVLVTAGPTQEALDPVRYLTNHSTGKMGYAIARAAAARGAQVTLVSGPTSLKRPAYLEMVDVVSAQDMFEAVTARAPEQDIIIKAAAVADYRPAHQAEDKLKKEDLGDAALTIPLSRTRDILAWLGEHRVPGQFLCGFSMETRDLVDNSRKKLEKKRLDLIAANSLKEAGAGFGTATNRLTLISPTDVLELPLLSKEEAAHALLDEILRRRAGRCAR